jgi:hypothetical protein
MPPGEYTVTHSAGLLTLSSSGTNHDFAATIVFGSQRRPANAAIHQLLFNRYGEEYFLSRVWHAGEKSGLQVQQGKTEKELIGRSSGPVQTASVQLRAR